MCAGQREENITDCINLIIKRMAKLKNRFAEFAMNICGPVVIGEDGLPCEAYRSNLRAIYLGLQRYIDAQNKWNTYEKALQEVRNGKKETHWVWFVFPQLYGLGSTPTAKYYGLSGREEAEEYLKNDLLRNRLIEISQAIIDIGKTVYEIFGNDAIKVRSCMLLFSSISDEPVFKQIVREHGWK